MDRYTCCTIGPETTVTFKAKERSTDESGNSQPMNTQHKAKPLASVPVPKPGRPDVKASTSQNSSKNSAIPPPQSAFAYLPAGNLTFKLFLLQSLQQLWRVVLKAHPWPIRTRRLENIKLSNLRVTISDTSQFLRAVGHDLTPLK